MVKIIIFIVSVFLLSCSQVDNKEKSSTDTKKNKISNGFCVAKIDTVLASGNKIHTIKVNDTCKLIITIQNKQVLFPQEVIETYARFPLLYRDDEYKILFIDGSSSGSRILVSVQYYKDSVYTNTFETYLYYGTKHEVYFYKDISKPNVIYVTGVFDTYKSDGSIWNYTKCERSIVLDKKYAKLEVEKFLVFKDSVDILFHNNKSLTIPFPITTKTYVK